MTTFLDTVRFTIIRHSMFEPGDTVVVAVSGGADSMALLHALVALREGMGLRLHVAHFDHRLRPDSASDAAFVEASAHALHVPVTVGTADVRSLATAQKRSIEDAARQARYEFLARVAAGAGAAAVATAHTRSDQVETVLMRVLDGAPWELCGGIPPVRALGPFRAVRPLFDLWRQQISEYLNGAMIVWREDPTNRDLTIRRNWLRHVALPGLERDVPGLRDVLWRMGDAVRAADRAIERLAAHLYASTRRQEDRTVTLPLRALEGRPAALQRRLVRRALADARGTTAGISRVVEDDALRLLTRRRPGEVPAGAWVVRRVYDVLQVAPVPPPPPEEEYRLPIPGTVEATAFGVSIGADLVPHQEGDPQDPDAVLLDADAAGPLLRIRPWRPGDRFRPLGMKGQKKVQDLLVDQKVPRWDRARVPIVVGAGDRILWIVGQRIAEDARVHEATRRVVRLRIHRLAAGAAEASFA